MERLTGLDASFLYMETPTLHMHVSMAAVFDPSTIRGGYSFERVHDLVRRRLVQAPVFTRRLVQVPFHLGHPYWVDDPHFDIDFHLRRAALPSPGGIAELAEFVGDVCGRQLDRSKPLWQMYIVEGLANGNIALVTKMHHSTIDGVSGAELLAKLFDLEAKPPPEKADAPPSSTARIPSDIELVAQALATRLAKPPRIARLAWKTAFALLDVRKVRQVRTEESSGKAALPLTAPRTSINAALTAHRKVAFASISLDDVKRLKNEKGTTVNDVVLAVCTGALRSYLQSRDELPDAPLVATVPVAVQDAAGIQGSNRVSAMFVNLPTQLDDPLERLETINKGTRGAKEEHNALGADVLLNWVEHATPNVFAAAARTYSRLKLADRHRPIHNLIVSNVPGPDFPLYFAGAEMVAGFPLGPVLEGAGLNITVMSYRGVLNWGLMACRETVAGADQIAEAIPAALDELLVAAGLPEGAAVGIAPGRRKTQSSKTQSSKNRTPKAKSSKIKTPKAPSKAETQKSESSKAQAQEAQAQEAQAQEASTAEVDSDIGSETVEAAQVEAEQVEAEQSDPVALPTPVHGTDPVVAVIGEATEPEHLEIDPGPSGYVVQEPIVQQPAAQEPAVQEPVVEEPVSQEPVAQEQVAHEQEVAEPKREWLDGPPDTDEVADLLAESGSVRVGTHVNPNVDANEGNVPDQNSPGMSNGSG